MQKTNSLTHCNDMHACLCIRQMADGSAFDCDCAFQDDFSILACGRQVQHCLGGSRTGPIRKRRLMICSPGFKRPPGHQVSRLFSLRDLLPSSPSCLAPSNMSRVNPSICRSIQTDQDACYQVWLERLSSFCCQGLLKRRAEKNDAAAF